MKAIHWDKEDEYLEYKNAILCCESCYKVINTGYLISPETNEEAEKLRNAWKSKPPKSSNAVCIHPDNILICKNCFKEKFVFKEKKRLPFSVSLKCKSFRT